MLLLCGRKYGHVKFQDYDHVQISMMYRSYSQIIGRATTDCVCYALDRDTFRKIMMQQGKSDMGRRVALLGKVRIFLSLFNFQGSCFCIWECAFTTIIVCMPRHFFGQYGSRTWCRMRVGVSGRLKLYGTGVYA